MIEKGENKHLMQYFNIVYRTRMNEMIRTMMLDEEEMDRQKNSRVHSAKSSKSNEGSGQEKKSEEDFNIDDEDPFNENLKDDQNSHKMSASRDSKGGGFRDYSINEKLTSSMKQLTPLELHGNQSNDYRHIHHSKTTVNNPGRRRLSVTKLLNRNASTRAGLDISKSEIQPDSINNSITEQSRDVTLSPVSPKHIPWEIDHDGHEDIPYEEATVVEIPKLDSNISLVVHSSPLKNQDSFALKLENLADLVKTPESDSKLPEQAEVQPKLIKSKFTTNLQTTIFSPLHMLPTRVIDENVIANTSINKLLKEDKIEALMSPSKAFHEPMEMHPDFTWTQHLMKRGFCKIGLSTPSRAYINDDTYLSVKTPTPMMKLRHVKPLQTPGKQTPAGFKNHPYFDLLLKNSPADTRGTKSQQTSIPDLDEELVTAIPNLINLITGENGGDRMDFVTDEKHGILPNSNILPPQDVDEEVPSWIPPKKGDTRKDSSMSDGSRRTISIGNRSVGKVKSKIGAFLMRLNSDRLDTPASNANTGSQANLTPVVPLLQMEGMKRPPSTEPLFAFNNLNPLLPEIAELKPTTSANQAPGRKNGVPNHLKSLASSKTKDTKPQLSQRDPIPHKHTIIRPIVHAKDSKDEAKSGNLSHSKNHANDKTTKKPFNFSTSVAQPPPKPTPREHHKEHLKPPIPKFTKGSKRHSTASENADPTPSSSSNPSSQLLTTSSNADSNISNRSSSSHSSSASSLEPLPSQPKSMMSKEELLMAIKGIFIQHGLDPYSVDLVLIVGQRCRRVQVQQDVA